MIDCKKMYKEAYTSFFTYKDIKLIMFDERV